MFDAKLKGDGLDVTEKPTRAPSNVIDLMAGLKKRFGEASKKAPVPAGFVQQQRPAATHCPALRPIPV